MASHDLDKEPWVEVIRAVIAASVDGNLNGGKNPRRLQLNISGRECELDIDDRWRVPRTMLADAKPAGSLSESSAEVFRNWLARRYDRAAFPDEFNNRIRDAADSIRSAVARAYQMSGLYIMMSSRGELPSEVPYTIDLFATMTVQDHGDPAARAEVLKAVGRIEAALAGCDGIVVREADAYSEAEMTLDDLHRYVRWEYDHVSFRPGKRGAIAPRP